MQGKIKTLTITGDVDHWSARFSCEVEAPEPLPCSNEEVGIDLGVRHLAPLSTGERSEHPRHYRNVRHILEQRQEGLSRKKRGSHRRQRAKHRLGRGHPKIRHQRRERVHNASRTLVNRSHVLVFEEIQSGNLTRKPRAKQDEQGKSLPNGAAAKGGLHKRLLDAGGGMFVGMCAAKAEEAGRTLLNVSPRFTSHLCSGCGAVRKKDVSERWAGIRATAEQNWTAM